MVEDENERPPAVRKTLKLSSPAVKRAAAPAKPTTLGKAERVDRVEGVEKTDRAERTARADKPGKGGPSEWADEHKRRMQADMDALTAPQTVRRR